MYFSYDFENCVLFLVLEKMNNTSLSGLDTNDITKKKKKVATDTNSWSWKARKNIGFGYCIPHLSDLHRYKVIEASLSTAKVNQSGNWFCNNPHSINLVKTELKNHPLSKKKKNHPLLQTWGSLKIDPNHIYCLDTSSNHTTPLLLQMFSNPKRPCTTAITGLHNCFCLGTYH